MYIGDWSDTKECYRKRFFSVLIFVSVVCWPAAHVAANQQYCTIELKQGINKTYHKCIVKSLCETRLKQVDKINSMSKDELDTKLVKLQKWGELDEVAAFFGWLPGSQKGDCKSSEMNINGRFSMMIR